MPRAKVKDTLQEFVNEYPYVLEVEAMMDQVLPWLIESEGVETTAPGLGQETTDLRESVMPSSADTGCGVWMLTEAGGILAVGLSGSMNNIPRVRIADGLWPYSPARPHRRPEEVEPSSNVLQAFSMDCPDAGLLHLARSSTNSAMMSGEGVFAETFHGPLALAGHV